MNIPTIRNDSRGHGYYGASRGNRGHNGIDLVCVFGHHVKAFKGGVFTKHGFPYRDSPYRYVEITDKDGFQARYFYVTRHLDLSVGDSVEAGAVIGCCQNIAERYDDKDKRPMTNHVHFEVKKDRLYIDPMKYIAEA